MSSMDIETMDNVYKHNMHLLRSTTFSTAPQPLIDLPWLIGCAQVNSDASKRLSEFFFANSKITIHGLVLLVTTPDQRTHRYSGFQYEYAAHQADCELGFDAFVSQKKRTILVLAGKDKTEENNMRMGIDGYSEVLDDSARAARQHVSCELEHTTTTFILQGPSNEGHSVVFGYHQDTIDNDNNLVTVCVRLSTLGDTHMKVFGGRGFTYGHNYGAASVFASDAWHTSISPMEEQLKIVFFFKRASPKRRKLVRIRDE